MSENYIVINGKRAELTEEQLRQLGIEVPKANPFTKSHKGKQYWWISTDGNVRDFTDNNDPVANDLYSVANYCTDKEIMEQRALRETLNRLLWRYAMEHTSKIKDKYVCYTIVKSSFNRRSTIEVRTCSRTLMFFGEIHFDTFEIAQSAIEEIIKPFMAAHPKFKW